MRVRSTDIQPRDRIGGKEVAVVFPGNVERYTTVVFDDHTLTHYRPETEIEVDR